MIVVSAGLTIKLSIRRSEDTYCRWFEAGLLVVSLQNKLPRIVSLHPGV